LGDLERLKLVSDNLPDEEPVRMLEKERGNGRNDNSVCCMWNNLLVGIVFQHPTTASLIRDYAKWIAM